MAELYSGISWYKTNVVKDVKDWNYHPLASYIEDSGASLPSASNISTSLDNKYIENSMTACKHYKIVVYTKETNNSRAIKRSNIYNSYGSSDLSSVTLTIKALMADSTQEFRIEQKFCLNDGCGSYDSTDGTGKYTFFFDSLNLGVTDNTITIENSTSNTIIIRNVIVYRSKDIGQIEENSVSSLSITDVEAYLDGMKVTFADSAVPIKMWWMEDENGAFGGINVNNEKAISFSRINQLLGNN